MDFAIPPLSLCFGLGATFCLGWCEIRRRIKENITHVCSNWRLPVAFESMILCEASDVSSDDGHCVLTAKPQQRVRESDVFGEASDVSTEGCEAITPIAPRHWSPSEHKGPSKQRKRKRNAEPSTAGSREKTTQVGTPCPWESMRGPSVTHDGNIADAVPPDFCAVLDFLVAACDGQELVLQWACVLRAQ